MPRLWRNFENVSWNFNEICWKMGRTFVQIFKYFNGNFVIFLHQFLEKTGMIELPVRSMPNCVICSTILYLTVQNNCGSVFYRHLCKVVGEGVMRKQMIQKWQCEFHIGWCDVHDLPQESWLKDSIMSDSIAGVRILISGSAWELLMKNGKCSAISRILIKRILTDELHMRKVYDECLGTYPKKTETIMWLRQSILWASM